MNKKRVIGALLLLILFIFLITKLFSCGKSDTEETAIIETEAAEADLSPDRSSSLEGIDKTDSNGLPESHVIQNVEIIDQRPELPTGCEITAFTIVMNYLGFNVDKTEMASKYMPTTEYNLYYGDDGKLYGPDIDKYFVGDPFTKLGYVCGYPVVVHAGEAYLKDHKLDDKYKVLGKDNFSFDEMYSLIAQDIPIMVFVTVNMEDRYFTEEWYTEDGKKIEWSINDHGSSIIGYSKDTVTMADPIAGLVEYERDQFESVMRQRGCMGVTIVPIDYSYPGNNAESASESTTQPQSQQTTTISEESGE